MIQKDILKAQVNTSFNVEIADVTNRKVYEQMHMLPSLSDASIVSFIHMSRWQET